MLKYKANVLYKIPHCVEIQAIFQAQWGGVRMFLFNFFLRLDYLMPSPLYIQNLPPVIKWGLTVSPITKQLFFTRSKPLQKSPSKHLFAAPQIISICSNLSCSYTTLVKMQILCKTRDCRIHRWRYFVWIKFFLILQVVPDISVGWVILYQLRWGGGRTVNQFMS